MTYSLQYDSMTYSLEKKYEIWNDKTGERYTIGPDSDCLGMIQLTQYGDDGVETGRMTFPDGTMDLIIEALTLAYNDAALVFNG